MKTTAILLGLSLSACTTVLTSLPAGAPTQTPPQYKAFCAVNECHDKSSLNTLPYTKKVRSDIQKAHTALRDKFISEREAAGQDIWRISTKGDCEDFALTLRRDMRLLRPNYSQAFNLATAFIPNGQYHAVLTINTLDGHLVCDLRYPRCEPWNTFPYEYDLLQNGEVWERLNK